MSFHWLDHAVALPKLQRLLRPRGQVAVLENAAVAHSEGAAFHETVQPVYRAHTPDLADPNLRTIDDLSDEEPTLATSDLFVHVATHRVLHLTRYTTESYLKLLQTFAPHRALPPETQAAVSEGIADVIERLSGEMTGPLAAVARLYMVA